MKEMHQELSELLAGLKFTPLPEPTPEDLRERDRQSWLRVAREIGIPSSLAEAELEPGPLFTTKAMDMVAHYLREGGGAAVGQCLTMLGPTGVGKTWAAVAALRKAVNVGRWFFYLPALASALLDWDRREETMRRATKTRFVVFDDLGTEYLKEGGVLIAALDEIFWTREGNRLPTIITSNLTPDEFKERMSDRIVDRLRGEWGRVVSTPGESLRRKK